MPRISEKNTFQVITVANQKGGVGKTTTVMNLGVALSRAGKRVLLIDCDPQANLTSYLGVKAGAGQGSLQTLHSLHSLSDLFLKKMVMNDKTLDSFIVKANSGVDLIASTEKLRDADYFLFSQPNRELFLRHFLYVLRARYDFILIDTPPSISFLTLNALVASDAVLCPIQAEFFSLEGIVKLQATIERVRNSWNPSLQLLGVLVNQVSARRKLTKEVMNALREELGDQLFDSTIANNSAVTESSGHATSVLEYLGSSKGAKDYVNAASELMLRCYGLYNEQREKKNLDSNWSIKSLTASNPQRETKKPEASA